MDTPAARYHFIDLAHAEANHAEYLPPVPPLDAPLEVYDKWTCTRDKLVADCQREFSKVRNLLCGRCSGTGTTQFKHRLGGICFQCKGSGWSSRGHQKYGR